MTQSWRRLDWGVAVDMAGGQQCDDSGCLLKVEPPDLVRGGGTRVGERKRKVLSMENQSHVLPVGLGRCGNVGKGETVASVLHSHTSCSYNRKHHLNQRLREQKTGS